jgi:hypothetical protein
MDQNMDDRRAPPRKVIHFARMEMFAMEFGDEQGRRITTTIFRMGGVWYHDPNAPGWAEKLRAVDRNSWLQKELDGAASSLEGTESGEVPKTDAVSISPR